MKTSRSQNVLSLIATAATTVLAGNTFAGTYTWNNVADPLGPSSPQSGDTWGKDTNWTPPAASPVAVPGANDIAELPQYASLTGGGPQLNTGTYNVGGITVDNGQADYTIGFGSSGTTLLAIGSSGLTVTNGGTLAIQPVVAISANQTWDVGTSTVTLSRAFDSGATGNLIKTGVGTLISPTGNSTRAGTTTIDDGTARLQTSQGFGSGMITVNGGTLEIGAGIGVAGGTTPTLQLNNGATLRGLGTGGSYNKTLNALPAGASVRIESGSSSSDYFTIGSSVSISGGSAPGVGGSVVTIGGAGTVKLFSGSTSYNGSWEVESGTLQLQTPGALGTNGSTARPIKLSGGTVIPGGGPNSTYTFSSIFTAGAGTSTIQVDRVETTGFVSNPSSITDRTLGGLVMDGGTLSVKLGSSVSSVSTTSTGWFAPVPLKVNTITLNNNTSSVLDVFQASGGVANRVGTTGLTGGGNLEKTGDGTLQIGGTSSNTGEFLVTKGNVYLGANGGLGLGSTSKLTLRSGTQLQLNQFGTDADTLALPGDLAGDGVIKIGNTGAGMITVTGQKVIAPAGDTGGAAILDVQSKVTANTATVNSVVQKPDLVIDVIGGNSNLNAVAGTDYDQLAVTGAFTNLNNLDIIVNLAGVTQADLNGDSLVVMTFASSTGGAPNVTFSGTANGTVHVNSTNVTIDGITGVPEPTSLAGIALAGLGMLARRRKSA